MKNIWILSNLSNKKYGDSTRPYFLGKYLSNYYKITQFCKTSGIDNKVKNILFFNKISMFNPFLLLKKTRKLNAKLKNEKPSILYTHQLVLSFIGALVKNKNKDLVFVSDFHTSAYFELINEPHTGVKFYIKRIIIPILEKYVAKKSDLIITVSKETKEILIKDYQVSPQKIKIVKNGTDLNTIYKVENPNLDIDKYHIDKSNIICVFPNPRDGFISNDLATDFLFKIANRIKEESLSVTFVVLGGGRIPENKPENVIFTGYVDNYNDWLNIADICIATYPKNAVCGGVRNKICDYLALGKPIVATKESMRGFDDLKEGVNYYNCETIDSFLVFFKSYNQNSKVNTEMKILNEKKSLEYNWKTKAEELNLIFKGLINA
mgnify:CR=1 FL=1